MGRRNSKQSRYDSMDQFGKRKYKQKNSPKGKKEKAWTAFVFERLKTEEVADERTE